MSSVVGRGRFDPPNAAGTEKNHGNDRLVAARDTTPRRAGRRNESACELSSRSRLAFAREEM
jgi:hypothetical protein